MGGAVLSRRVFVTNIPLNAYANGWVEVDDDVTDRVNVNGAISAAVREGRFAFETTVLRLPDDAEVDEAVIHAGWQFSTPLE